MQDFDIIFYDKPDGTDISAKIKLSQLREK